MQATSSTELNGINLAAAPALVQLEDADPPAVSEGSGEAEAYGSDSSEEEDGIVPRISALPADLRHVASLLSDSSAPGSSAPDSRQAQTAGCVRGRKRARGAVLQQRQRRAAPAADGASAAGLAAAGTSEQPWNSPGEDSSANVRLRRSPLWYCGCKLSVCLHNGRYAALAVLHAATLNAGALEGLTGAGCCCRRGGARRASAGCLVRRTASRPGARTCRASATAGRRCPCCTLARAALCSSARLSPRQVRAGAPSLPMSSRVVDGVRCLR
jgi:hypothetical protein